MPTLWEQARLYCSMRRTEKKGGYNMKFKTTKKEIMNSHSTIIKAGYCTLQYLLTFEEPIAYTSGVNGWGADVYKFGGVAIVTGYAPFGTVALGYETNKRYEDKAREIRCNYDITWEQQKEQIQALLQEYIKEALQQK